MKPHKQLKNHIKSIETIEKPYQNLQKHNKNTIEKPYE